MSENKEAPKAKKEKKVEAEGSEEVVHVHHSRVKTKSKWTIEKCKTFAHRFKNEAEWSMGSPASYKSAQAHGWVALCMPSAKSGRRAG